MATPAASLANGGDQRVIQNKYLINLSRAPFTPRVNVKTSMLASFVDIQKSKLIAEDLIAKVRIAKLGGGMDKQEFLLEQDNLPVKNGVLELAYTFTEAGLHEIFFDFAFATYPKTIYAAPDFLLDIQPALQDKNSDTKTLMVGIYIGGIIGALATWLLVRRRNKNI